MEQNNPKPGDIRVAICEYTGKEVVQQLVTNYRKKIVRMRDFRHVEDINIDNEWLCLHENTDEEDVIELEKFKKSNNGK